MHRLTRKSRRPGELAPRQRATPTETRHANSPYLLLAASATGPNSGSSTPHRRFEYRRSRTEREFANGRLPANVFRSSTYRAHSRPKIKTALSRRSLGHDTRSQHDLGHEPGLSRVWRGPIASAEPWRPIEIARRPAFRLLRVAIRIFRAQPTASSLKSMTVRKRERLLHGSALRLARIASR